jgi:hypothetical protein
MSDVLASSQPKAVLLTGLTNPQVVRTVQIAEFRAIIFVRGKQPQADVAMIPPFIVQKALEHHIDIIAITDHNSSANVGAVQKAAEGTNLTVLPGMEVQSHEDVHLLTLFENVETLETWQEQVNNSLPDLQNQPQFFGE